MICLRCANSTICGVPLSQPIVNSSFLGRMVEHSPQTNFLFKKCWTQANPETDISKLPRLRVYDLRHRFTSAVLNKWLDEGRNLYAMLPFLSAYMGHSSLSATAYYIHLLPENLVKSAGIDWLSFDQLIPEVSKWQW